MTDPGSAILVSVVALVLLVIPLLILAFFPCKSCAPTHGKSNVDLFAAIPTVSNFPAATSVVAAGAASADKEDAHASKEAPHCGSCGCEHGKSDSDRYIVKPKVTNAEEARHDSERYIIKPKVREE